MPLNERSPLIDHYYFDDEEEEEDEEISCLQKCFTLIFFIIALVIVILIFIPHHNINDHDIPNDISNVPYQYILSHKSLWYFGYIIETLPVAFSDDQSEYDILGEIVSISTSWAFGNYELLEFRQNFTSNEITPVKTANSSLSLWKNVAYISFEKDLFNNTNTPLTDPINPAICDYKIMWDWVFDGRIFRKCELANETHYTPISLVKGSTSWGLNFLSEDGGDVYASTSEAEYWWNMNRRDVDVKLDAPFPPILPALYTAYYDTIRRNYENHHRRH